MSTCSVPVVSFGNHDPAPVRIEQNFFGVETQTSGRIKRSMDSIPIEVSRANAGHKHMPIVIGAIGNGIDSDHIGRLRIVLPIEEKNLTAVALRENTLKFTPSRVTMALRGAVLPLVVVVERERLLLANDKFESMITSIALTRI